MITPEGRAALRALWDCGVAQSRWDHAGYRNLREQRLVDHQSINGGALVSHRLNQAGRTMAEEIFKCD